MPVAAPKPVDIACLLLIARGRRQGLRARCPGDRFRAAMAILKQEKERMRGKWSLDSTYEWPDDGSDTGETAGSPVAVEACEVKPFFPVTASAFGTPAPSRPRDGGPAHCPAPQFHRVVRHVPPPDETPAIRSGDRAPCCDVLPRRKGLSVDERRTVPLGPDTLHSRRCLASASRVGWLTVSPRSAVRGIAMRVRLFAALLVAGVAHAQEPKAPAKPVVGTWEVKYTDDSTMKLTLLEDTISLLTPHGTLQIPVRDIKKIEFGTRLSEADQKAVDAAVADLTGTDNAKREAAKGLLAEIGPKALGAAQRAARPLTGDARAQFTQVIDKLTAQLPNRKSAPRDTDVIHTDESVIAGRLALASLRVNTFQFGEQKLKTSDVTVMQFGKLVAVAAARNDNIELVDANTLTQIAIPRVGQTVGVRVTGVANGAVWGSGPYTSDSTLGMAAVHAGVLKVGETGVVRIHFVPSPPAYTGTTENGVTTMIYGPFTAGSHEIVKQP